MRLARGTAAFLRCHIGAYARLSNGVRPGIDGSTVSFRRAKQGHTAKRGGVRIGISRGATLNTSAAIKILTQNSRKE
jgi:hypothetical protein